MPLAMRTDVIDQVLEIAVHPAYDCMTSKMSVEIIHSLAQSAKTHTYIVRREILEKMLEICEQRLKMINQQSSQTQKRKEKDLMELNLLKCVAISPLYFNLAISLFYLITRVHTLVQTPAH